MRTPERRNELRQVYGRGAIKGWATRRARYISVPRELLERLLSRTKPRPDFLNVLAPQEEIDELRALLARQDKETDRHG